jgi:hypothetical protein
MSNPILRGFVDIVCRLSGILPRRGEYYASSCDVESGKVVAFLVVQRLEGFKQGGGACLASASWVQGIVIAFAMNYRPRTFAARRFRIPFYGYPWKISLNGDFPSPARSR